MAVKQITLRAWSDNSDVAPVKINQGDILSRTVIIMLVDSGGTPIDLTLSSVRVHFSKPDGTVAYLTASIVNAAAGIISVTLDSQCTAVPGAVKSIVQVTGPNGENTFIIGPVFAVGAINIEGSIISANEFTALTDALAQVQGIANKADLNADGKVIQDPASYGKANGAILFPPTLPTLGKILTAGAGGKADSIPYESGTFTPSLKGSTTAGVFTYYDQFGQYTVIGNICVTQIYIKINAITTPAAGNLMLSGLPKVGTEMPHHPDIPGCVAGANFTGAIDTTDGTIYQPNCNGYTHAETLKSMDGFCCTLVYRC